MRGGLLLCIGCLLAGTLCATIRNGYEVHIDSVNNTLQQLFQRQDQERDPVQRRKIKRQISRYMEYVAHYEITEQLLGQLLILSPDLFQSVNRLKDKQGRRVDVYVTLVPRKEATTSLSGASFFWQDRLDPDASRSEYGQHSVSIQLCITARAMRMLYHELGHISYIVPNLAAYMKFYRLRYNHVEDVNMMGHHPRDRSGQQALAYEEKYRQDYEDYKHTCGLTFKSACALLQDYKRNNRHVSQHIELIAFRP